jgi:RNA polymerase sigma-70 factor (ECF subfamily)
LLLAAVPETLAVPQRSAPTIDGVDHAVTPPATLDAFLAGVERRAFSRAMRATQDRDEALDLVQDAMFQLARRYASRPAGEWPALFQRILTNRIRDWQRRQTLRRRLFFWRAPATDEGVDSDDLIERLADTNLPDGAGSLLRDELLQQLVAALEQLPARQREAFELRVWEGLTVSEAATAMGCSEGSVKTHLSRAMASLRDVLEGEST